MSYLLRLERQAERDLRRLPPKVLRAVDHDAKTVSVYRIRPRGSAYRK